MQRQSAQTPIQRFKPFSNIVNKVKNTVSRGVNAAKSGINTVKNKVTSGVNNVKNKVTSGVNTVKNKVARAVTPVKNKVSAVVNNVKNKVTSGVNTVKNKVARAVTPVKNKVSGVVNNVKNKVTSGVNTVKNKVARAVTPVKNKVSAVVNNVKNKVTSGVNTVKNKVARAVTPVKNKVSGVVNNVKNKVTSSVNTVKNKVARAVTPVKNKVSGVVNNVKNKVTSGVNTVKNQVAGVVNNVKNKVGRGVNTVKNQVAGVVNNVKNKVSSGVNTVKNKVTGVVNSATNKVTSGVNTVKNTVKQTGNQLKNTAGNLSQKGKNALSSLTKLTGNWGTDAGQQALEYWAARAVEGENQGGLGGLAKQATRQHIWLVGRAVDRENAATTAVTLGTAGLGAAANAGKLGSLGASGDRAIGQSGYRLRTCRQRTHVRGCFLRWRSDGRRYQRTRYLGQCFQPEERQQRFGSGALSSALSLAGGTASLGKLGALSKPTLGGLAAYGTFSDGQDIGAGITGTDMQGNSLDAMERLKRGGIGLLGAVDLASPGGRYPLTPESGVKGAGSRSHETTPKTEGLDLPGERDSSAKPLTPANHLPNAGKPEIEPGVVTKQKTHDGHELKVLRDGSVVRCSNCETLETRYKHLFNRKNEYPSQIQEKITQLDASVREIRQLQQQENANKPEIDTRLTIIKEELRAIEDSEYGNLKQKEREAVERFEQLKGTKQTEEANQVKGDVKLYQKDLRRLREIQQARLQESLASMGVSTTKEQLRGMAGYANGHKLPQETIKAIVQQAGGWNEVKKKFVEYPPLMRQIIAERARVVDRTFREAMDDIARDPGQFTSDQEVIELLKTPGKERLKNVKLLPIGSKDLTSDYDATIVAKPEDGVLEILGVLAFNKRFREHSGQESGTVFDTNVYTTGHMPASSLSKDGQEYSALGGILHNRSDIKELEQQLNEIRDPERTPVKDPKQRSGMEQQIQQQIRGKNKDIKESVAQINKLRKSRGEKPLSVDEAMGNLESRRNELKQSLKEKIKGEEAIQNRGVSNDTKVTIAKNQEIMSLVKMRRFMTEAEWAEYSKAMRDSGAEASQLGEADKIFNILQGELKTRERNLPEAVKDRENHASNRLY